MNSINKPILEVSKIFIARKDFFRLEFRKNSIEGQKYTINSFQDAIKKMEAY